MRWLAVAMALLVGCTPAGGPSESARAPATQAPSAAAPPGGLAAADPPPPTVAQFRARAATACATAAAGIARAPLRGDPFAAGARPRDARAAIAHFRAAAAAWTGVAGELWEFGLPRARPAEHLVTRLDTLAQYSHQVAELMAEGDRDGAQLALGAVDQATRQVNRTAQRLGLGPIEHCAGGRPRLAGAERVRVTARDFSFTAPEVRAGPTRFVLVNQGEEPHHLGVVRLREPGTLDDAVRTDREGRDPGPLLRREPRTSAVAQPGDRVALDVRLRRGTYGLVCFVAAPDGTPHAYKGMALELTVTR